MNEKKNDSIKSVKIDLLSLFPDYFDSPLSCSILKRGQEKGLIEINRIDIRDFAKGVHRKVDDRPYGGGPGMVMMPGPVSDAIQSVKKEDSKVIYLTPQGNKFDAKIAERLASYSHIILLLGHYEGVDQRVIDEEVDEEISIGDFVLTSGCPAALILIDALSRFIPGMLGDEQSAYQDSFHVDGFDWEHYTRPYNYKGKTVPDILLSGDHAKIEKWRKEQAKNKTRRVRPDLYNQSE